LLHQRDRPLKHFALIAILGDPRLAPVGIVRCGGVCNRAMPCAYSDVLGRAALRNVILSFRQHAPSALIRLR
jgi:hypothetical protein